MLDDATRRQLRFSLFLQGVAVVMLTVAAVLRIGSLGWDLVALVLIAGIVVVAAAFLWTLSRLRAG